MRGKSERGVIGRGEEQRDINPWMVVYRGIPRNRFWLEYTTYRLSHHVECILHQLIEVIATLSADVPHIFQVRNTSCYLQLL